MKHTADDEFHDEFRIVSKPFRSALLSTVAISHMQLLSTWNVANPNWDALQVSYTHQILRT